MCVSLGRLTVKGIVFDRVNTAYEQPRLVLNDLRVTSLLKSGQLSEIAKRHAGYLESELKKMTLWLENTLEDLVLAAHCISTGI